MNKYISLAMMMFPLGVMAQRDTTKQPAIEIISSYKPVLRNASKINLSGTQLTADTNRRVAAYNIPVQQLFYAYQPAQLNALAIDTDAEIKTGERYYLKAGFGNLSTPYIKAAAVFGDERTKLLNLYADHRSSRGPIEHQDFSNTEIKGVGTYITDDYTFNLSAGIKLDNYNLYGYDHAVHTPAKDDIKQNYQTIYIQGGMQNVKPGPWDIDYNPTVKFSYFTLADKLNETSLALKVPVQKKFGKDLLAKVSAEVDYTRFASKITGEESFNNTIVRLAPGIKYFGDGAFIHAGIAPTFHNSKSDILPDLYFEIKLENRYVLQGGWIGRVHKNSVENLSEINPFIRGPFSNINTKATEFYGGIRASIGSHFNIGGKVSWINYRNAMLFLNDTIGITNHFITQTEDRLNNLRISGNVSYILQEKFSITGNVALNAFNNQRTFSRAWNLVPLEVSGSASYNLMKKLLLKADVNVFGGPRTFDKDNGSFRMDGGTDLSAGAVYSINKQFSVWLDVNNILNNKYSRWNNYPVYGINVLGGIIVRF